ncbi:winged helix-turn-helix domain-containing protein [Halapricum hydrolyticum]|uniref:Helix-turn-helix domain-containing protein n=1 Tax=Halapricum hydrolyticum TaxID=2979991 RepID=A0AAE3LGC8_9EURY|nr:winged helix-turn-helix domain-containing protein [Halapricum hydrolyticum]MCU4716936.1 helix-turn-helix domain-containing protein [Halapricum hydrolyticum]MCU4725459.1 helix-turn-helix domain-containing protein [Halapricum hydrolyticum]
MAEFASEVTIDDIVVRDTDVSRAVEEPLRAMILDMLAEQAMSIDQLHESLTERGYDRTENTVRHHVNELRDAGLVEIARLEEGRGGTKKFYEANTIVLSYALPDDREADIERMVESIQPGVAAILDQLADEYGADIDAIAGEMAPCEHCGTQKYEPYVMLTVLRRAFVRSMSNG